MGGLSRWAVRKPWWALLAFIVMAGVIGFLGNAKGGDLNDSFSLPDTESKVATDLLSDLGGDFDKATADIVWSPDSGSATESATTILPLLTKVSALPGVACVTNPFSTTGESLGTACPPAQQQPAPKPGATAAELEKFKAAGAAAAAAYSPFSPDGHVGKATITFVGPGDGSEVPPATATTIIAEVKAANAQDGLQVGANGQVLAFAGQEPPSSEGIGMLVALIILLLAFGSLLAAGLPLLTAGFGVGLGASLLLWIANFTDVATFAPTLAAMIGLGVGIDYSLFVINRFRQATLAGHDAKQAALESVNTSGRAVVFAASTVVIALLGLFVMRINFFNGLALAASGTVILVMLSAVWLLPALLSLLGKNAVTPGSALIARGLRRIKLGALAVPFEWLYSKTRHARTTQEWHPEGGRWAHYARFLQKRPLLPALLSIGLVLLLAVPALSLRLGFPDDSGTPEGSISRIAYDLTSEGFGPGANGPFIVAVELPAAGDTASLAAVITALKDTEGVASTNPSVEMLPLYEGQLGTVAAVQVQPTTSPQDVKTTDLLDRLRTETIPPVAATTGAQAYVGGTTAITADFSTVMRDAMPVFLSVVVGLGFIMLLILFRSAVVSLTAVITSLLSFAASMGITVAVFQWGWLNGILGVTGTGPIFPFLPVMVFAILFGLSMDYHVFLVSRMQEEWSRTHDNAVAVRRGIAGSGKVVLMAALIMFSVFAAFIPTPNNTIKLFGVALASAVLVDAFLIRLVFVPSLMSILGNANWWLPAWLANRLPHFDVEGGADEITDDEEPDSVGGEREPAEAR
jgi:RND superfamily putative drug exporter